MIPVNEPLLAGNTLKYVSECIETGWISSAGSYIRKFEEAFASYIGVKHAITTTSGTTALHLALASLNIGPDDAVIIPDLTMIAVPYAVMYTGATPILVDVDREIFNLDPARLQTYLRQKCRYNDREKSLIDIRTGKKVKCILPVHLYGHSCAMDEIRELAAEYGLQILEDAAEAHGALYYPHGDKNRAKRAGSMGEAACFSFYGNKIITTGEGGMVVTDSDDIAARARSLKDLAHSPQRRFLHTELAFNYRMTNLQAAVGLSQLEEIDRFIAIKQKMASLYNSLLGGLEGLTLPVEKPWARNVYWMYAVVVEDTFGLSRDSLMDLLKKGGVDTRSFFIPVHQQPVFAEDYKDQFFPVTEELSRKGMYLPSGLALTGDQIRSVCTILKAIRDDVE